MSRLSGSAKGAAGRFTPRLPVIVSAACLSILLTGDMTSGASDLKRIVLYTYGPVVLQFIDPSGLRSGRDFETDEKLEEIPGSTV